jgi:hypothetical protein
MQGAMAGALAAAGAGTMLSRGRARAGGPDIPKRIVFFYVQTGSMPGRWDPILRAGASPSTETDWDVNTDLHGELAPYRADLNYFENLDFISEYGDPTDPANSHYQGGTHSMAACHRLTGNQAGGITIDQFIAERLNASGPLTPLPSLELRVGDGSGEGATSASGPGAPLPRISDPAEAYDRLFPAGSTMPDPDAARIAMRRRRVFELVRGRSDALAASLAGTERMRIEQYRGSVADLEARLSLTGTGAAPPDRSILDPLTGLDSHDPDAVYRAQSEIDVKLTAAALHSDVTRVVSLELGDAPNGEIGYTPGQFGTTDTHDLLHKVMDISGREPASSDPDAIDTIRRQHQAATHRMRLLLDELASRTESDGQRLLDHTVVVFVSQIADGSHCLQGMPWYTVGSCGGAIATGRYFRTARRADVTPVRWISPRWDGGGRSHNDLYVTLTHAMGVGADTFGEPSACTGPIPGMLT